MDGTRKDAVSTVTSQNAEDVCHVIYYYYSFTLLFFSIIKFFILSKQIASRSNVEKNDAYSSSSFVEILDIPTTSKRPRLLTMHEKPNDRRDVHFNNRSESVLRNCQHTITSSSSTSVASTVPKERNLRGRRKMTHQEAEIIDLTL